MPSNVRVGGNLRVVGWEMTKNVEKMEKRLKIGSSSFGIKFGAQSAICTYSYSKLKQYISSEGRRYIYEAE